MIIGGTIIPVKDCQYKGHPNPKSQKTVLGSCDSSGRDNLTVGRAGGPCCTALQDWDAPQYTNSPEIGIVIGGAIRIPIKDS